jgi:flagellar hook-associated protein 3 FlgL
MFRVSNYALNSINLANITNLQSRIADRSIAISSGKESMRFSGIAENANRLVNLEAAHVRSEQFIKNNQTVDTRLQNMETQIGNMFSIATDLRSLLVQAINANNLDSMALQTQAQNMMEQVGGFLNVKQDGRYLFAGTMTNTRPVDLTDVGFVTPPPIYPGTANTAYYQGNSTKLTARADENLSVTYGVTADQTGFEELIRALKLTATTATTSPPDDLRLNEALRVVNLALNDLPDIRTTIGAARATLERANTALGEGMLYAEQTIGELENTDLTRAITLVTGDQSALEASFAAFAQLQSVSLLNFL